MMAAKKSFRLAGGRAFAFLRKECIGQKFLRCGETERRGLLGEIFGGKPFSAIVRQGAGSTLQKTVDCFLRGGRLNGMVSFGIRIHKAMSRCKRMYLGMGDMFQFFSHALHIKSILFGKQQKHRTGRLLRHVIPDS